MSKDVLKHLSKQHIFLIWKIFLPGAPPLSWSCRSCRVMFKFTSLLVFFKCIFLCTDFPWPCLCFCLSKQRGSSPDSVFASTHPLRLQGVAADTCTSQGRVQRASPFFSSELNPCPCAAVPLHTPQRVTRVTVSLEGGEPSQPRLEEQCPACFEWQSLGGCSAGEQPRQKALISPEPCFVLLSDRTSIVGAPEDSTVIKGTTATLRCEATHDPRISIRLVVPLLLCVVYPGLIL